MSPPPFRAVEMRRGRGMVGYRGRRLLRMEKSTAVSTAMMAAMMASASARERVGGANRPSCENSMRAATTPTLLMSVRAKTAVFSVCEVSS